MSDDTRGQAPPAYGTLEPSELAIQIFLDRIHHTVNAECYSATENSAETKRLRDFLFYCLAVDYRFPCSLTVTATNREHFLELAEVLWSVKTIHRDIHLEPEDRVILAPYLWKYLHEPCTSLAIPVESAVAIILRYEKFLNFRGRYKGCIHGLLHNRGAATLAEKMAMDRSILIPRLVTSEQTRREFTEKMNEIARSYFTYIGGLTSEISVRPETQRFTEQVRTEYTLTPRGELYEENRKGALTTVKRSIEHFLDGTLGHRLRIRRRFEEVFAKGPREEYYDWSLMPPASVPPVTPKDSPTWSSRPRWRDHESVFLPDLFEHRTGQGYCDT